MLNPCEVSTCELLNEHVRYDRWVVLLTICAHNCSISRRYTLLIYLEVSYSDRGLRQAHFVLSCSFELQLNAVYHHVGHDITIGLLGIGCISSCSTRCYMS